MHVDKKTRTSENKQNQTTTNEFSAHRCRFCEEALHAGRKQKRKRNRRNEKRRRNETKEERDTFIDEAATGQRNGVLI